MSSALTGQRTSRDRSLMSSTGWLLRFEFEVLVENLGLILVPWGGGFRFDCGVVT